MQGNQTIYNLSADTGISEWKVKTFFRTAYWSNLVFTGKVDYHNYADLLKALTEYYA